MGDQGRLRPWYDRFAPRSLRARIAGATAALSLAIVAATFGVTYLVASGLLDRLAQLSATANLEAFHQFVDVESRNLDAYAANFASSESLYRRCSGPIDPRWAKTFLDGALRQRSGSSCIVVVAPRGGVLYASGRPEDARALASTAVGDQPAEGRSGLLWLPSGLAVVAARPVFGTDGTTARASLVLARPLAPDVADDFRPPTGTLQVELLPPEQSSLLGQSTVAGFTGVAFARDFDAALTTAGLIGVDGKLASVARFTFEDPRTRIAATAGVGAALLAALLAGVLGTMYGIVIARAVREPLERTVEGIEQQGHRVLEGAPYGPLEVPDTAFEELRTLRGVVDELLGALSERQSELREATMRAQETERAMRTMADDSPEMMLLIDRLTIVHANPAAAEAVGIPAERLAGKHVGILLLGNKFLSEDGKRLGMMQLSRAVDGPLVVRFKRKGAPERWIEIMAVSRTDSQERILVSARDITEQRRLDAVREEILSLITHDLRAPLTVINGYLDILRRPLEDPAKDRAIEAAKLNAEKMAGLLEDLLDVARAEELLAPRVLAPVDLAALVEEVVASLSAASAGHEIVVQKEASPVVLGEDRRIRQALVNLVTNALKYSPEGTRVTVRLSLGDGSGTVAVEDEGPGIPEQERSHVFDRYRRLDATTNGKPGHGLGLYIVRVIAEKHGGRVRVEDAPAGGARFVLEIPLAAEESAAEGAVAS